VRIEIGSPTVNCSGGWAVGGFSRYPDPGAPQNYAYAQLFGYVDGRWTPEDSTDTCASAELPGSIRQSVCDAG